MRIPRCLSWFFLGLAVLTSGQAAETLSERTLKEIVARQKNIFERAEVEKDHLDEAWLRGELQALINSYDGTRYAFN